MADYKEKFCMYCGKWREDKGFKKPIGKSARGAHMCQICHDQREKDKKA